MKTPKSNQPLRQKRWLGSHGGITGMGAFIGLAVLSLGLQRADASFSDAPGSWNNCSGHFYGGTLWTGNGTFSSSGSAYSSGSLPNSSATFGWDTYVGGNAMSGTDYFSVGALYWGGNSATINLSGTQQGIASGSGVCYAAGLLACSFYGSSGGLNLTINNNGTCDGQVQNHDGASAGIYQYSLYGGATVNNNSGCTASATANYYAGGINCSDYYGPVNLYNRGTASASASQYAAALDCYSFDGASGAPIYCENSGSATASAGSYGIGIMLFAGGGACTLNNYGYVSASGTTAKGIYAANSRGTLNFNNTGTINVTAGSSGGWGAGVETDNAGDACNVSNSGTITHNNGSALMAFHGSTGTAGTLTVNNSGTLNAPLGVDLSHWNGNCNFTDSGDIPQGNIWLSTGNDTVSINGAPTIGGTINGNGGYNTLTFTLSGTLEKVNGQTATQGNNLSAYGLGSSGNITVSGKTYSWSGFNSVGGTCGSGGGGGTIANGTYKLIARHSGKALDAYNNGTANGTQIIQWSYGGGANQKWTVTGLGSGNYKIIGVQSGKALDVYNYQTANGSKVELWDYNGGANQTFTFSGTDSGYYRITPNSATGSCLDVNGVSTADGAVVQLWQWTGGNNQQWSLQAP